MSTVLLPPNFVAEVNLGTNGTLKNVGSNTIYYRDEPGVSTTTNDGTLANGASVSLSGGQWLLSTTGTTALVTPGVVQSGAVGPQGDQGPTGPAGADGAAGADAIGPVVLNAQTNDYTLVIADAYARVQVTKATPVTVTVPAFATVAFTVGTAIEIAQRGIGTVTIAAAGGVTLNSPNGLRSLSGQYACASLINVATNEWDMVGDLV